MNHMRSRLNRFDPFTELLPLITANYHNDSEQLSVTEAARFFLSLQAGHNAGRERWQADSLRRVRAFLNTSVPP